MKTNQEDTTEGQKKVLSELAVVKGLTIGVLVALFLFFLLHWCVFWATN
jgi:hypothetical protein